MPNTAPETSYSLDTENAEAPKPEGKSRFAIMQERVVRASSAIRQQFDHLAEKSAVSKIPQAEMQQDQEQLAQLHETIISETKRVRELLEERKKTTDAAYESRAHVELASKEELQSAVKKLKQELGFSQESIDVVPISSEVKRRIIDEHFNQLEERMRQENGNIFERRQKENELYHHHEHTAKEKARIQAAEKRLSARDIVDAPIKLALITENSAVYDKDLKSEEIATNLAEITTEELQKGIACLKKFGYYTYTDDFKSKALIDTLKSIAQADQQDIDKLYQQLSSYGVLSERVYSLTNYRGEIENNEFNTIAAIIQQGGLKTEQQAKLAQAKHFLRLSGQDYYFSINEDGKLRDDFSPSLSFVLSNSLPLTIADPLQTILESNVYENIKKDNEYKRIHPGVDKNIIEKIIKFGDIIPLTQIAELVDRNILPSSFFNDSYLNPIDVDKLIKDCNASTQLAQSPEKYAWTQVYQDLMTREDGSPLWIPGMDFYNDFYEKRHQLGNAIVVLNALQARDNFKYVVEAKYDERKIAINIDKVAEAITYRQKDIGTLNGSLLEEIDSLVTNEASFYGSGKYIDHASLGYAAFLIKNQESFPQWFFGSKTPRDEFLQEVLTGNLHDNKNVVATVIAKYYWEIARNDPTLKTIIDNLETFIEHAPPKKIADICGHIMWSKGTELQSFPLRHETKQFLLALNKEPKEEIKVVYAKYNKPEHFVNGEATKALFRAILKNNDISSLTALYDRILANDPTLLVPYVSSFINRITMPQIVSFADTISHDILVDSFPDQSIKDCFLAIKNVPSDEVKLIYARNRQEGNFANGKPAQLLFETLFQIKDFISLKTILKSSPDIMQGVVPKDKKTLIEFWSLMPDKLRNQAFLETSDFPHLPAEKMREYQNRSTLIKLVEESPSSEIRRLSQEITDQLCTVENPNYVFQQIEDIFISNNLPLVGKIYRIFETIYDNPRNGNVSLLRSNN